MSRFAFCVQVLPGTACRALASGAAMVLAGGLALPASAFAQAVPTARFAAMPERYVGAAPNTYGGGLIEFLLSGASASTAAASRRGSVGILPAYARIEPDADARAAAIDPRYARQIVAYDGNEKPGTIIIDTPERLLYLVADGGKAMRYGIGVGRPGFTWAGTKTVSMKREWPDWRPPDEMLKRRPDLPHYMPGGPENPLGARALYLGSSLYRIHGSNEPWTIGTQVSSGCIRMRNEDVIDLYERVPVGAKVVVI
jgi:lipoprotein-anchoring transpeptidase ErfK/SrfK